MAWAGFHSIANSSALMPRFAATIISPWQTAFQCTADFQLLFWGLIQTMRRVQVCGNPLSNSDSRLWQSAVWPSSLWQSAEYTPRSANTGLKIWARSLATEWNPAPPILHQETGCLKRRIFLTRDFKSLKLIRGAMFRPMLYANGLSLNTISWHYTFKR
jgi:hypothetical protein